MTEFWRDRSVFITGGTGLLGSWLVKGLVDAGANVACLVHDRAPNVDNPIINVVCGDLINPRFLDRALDLYRVEVVFHLAAQAIVGIANHSPLSTFETNIRGTWNLLEACRLSPSVKSIVVASSDKAYGDQPVLPYTEDMPLQGRHPYDVSKSCADLIAQSYANTFGLPVAVTRCGNFYGGGDLNWNRIVPGTIRAILRGERPIIRSDGQSMRDYFYVEDGAAAAMLLAERLAIEPRLGGSAFNFSNESPVTALAMVNLILAKMDSNLEPAIQNHAPHEIRHQYLSARRAHEELGWSPTFTLDEGLTKTIAWYREALG